MSTDSSRETGDVKLPSLLKRFGKGINQIQVWLHGFRRIIDEGYRCGCRQDRCIDLYVTGSINAASPADFQQILSAQLVKNHRLQREQDVITHADSSVDGSIVGKSSHETPLSVGAHSCACLNNTNPTEGEHGPGGNPPATPTRLSDSERLPGASV